MQLVVAEFLEVGQPLTSVADDGPQLRHLPEMVGGSKTGVPAPPTRANVMFADCVVTLGSQQEEGAVVIAADRFGHFSDFVYAVEAEQSEGEVAQRCVRAKIEIGRMRRSRWSNSARVYPATGPIFRARDLGYSRTLVVLAWPW